MLSVGARKRLLPIGTVVIHRTRGSGIVTGHSEEHIRIRFMREDLTTRRPAKGHSLRISSCQTFGVSNFT
jgi:hypothetical protein